MCGGNSSLHHQNPTPPLDFLTSNSKNLTPVGSKFFNNMSLHPFAWGHLSPGNHFWLPPWTKAALAQRDLMLSCTDRSSAVITMHNTGDSGGRVAEPDQDPWLSASLDHLK